MTITLSNDRIHVDAYDEVPEGRCLVITPNLDVFYAGWIYNLPDEAPPTGSIMLMSPEDFIRFKEMIKRRTN